MVGCLIEDVPSHVEQIWVAVGFLGQGIFGARMLVQWLASERAGRSVIPIVFWYMSVVGSVITLTYAIYRLDPVFIVSQVGGLLVYVRNLSLIYVERSRLSG